MFNYHSFGFKEAHGHDQQKGLRIIKYNSKIYNGNGKKLFFLLNFFSNPILSYSN